MRNAKEEIVGKIIYDMDKFLTKEQLNELSNVLNIELHKYTVEEEKCEIVEYDNYDQHIIEQYYASLTVCGKSKKTIERYLYVLRKLLDFVNKPIKEIQTEDIRFYLAMYKKTRNVSNTTLEGTRKCINAFFSWAEENDYIIKSPSRRIKPIKTDTVQEPSLTQGQIESCMLSCNEPLYKAIIQFLYDTGARVSEICKIDLREIDFRNRSVLLHGKGGKDRIVYFTDKAEMYIKYYLHNRKVNSSMLFATNRTGMIHKATIESVFRNIGANAGVNRFHPHRLRVTRITDLIDRGMPIQDVQEFAGHSSINTTKGYYRNKDSNVQYSYMRAS